MKKFFEMISTDLIKKGTACFLSFIFTLFLLRCYEFIIIEGVSKPSAILSWRSIGLDISFGSRVFLMLLLIQFIFNKLLKREKNGFVRFAPLFFILLEWILFQYFIQTGILLDEVFYSYSLKELQTIVGGSSFSIEILIGFLFFPFCYLGFSYLLDKINRKFNWFWIVQVIPLLLGGFLRTTSFQYNEEVTQLSNNKTAYFLWRSADLWFRKGKEKAIYSPEDFAILKDSFFGGVPLIEDYPLYHKLPETSLFADYFNPTSDGKSPNLVFIICESLETSFVGDNASSTGRVMPFLDSLASQSLYWPNFLSLYDRTHHVLPATLNSLPILTEGKFVQEMEKYPDFQSLIELTKSDYFSRFFCGTYLGFTKMDGFMEANQTDYLVGNWETDLPDSIKKKRMQWGFHEQELFMKSWLDYKNQGLERRKRLDVFLTNSTHPPFDLYDKKKYLEGAKKVIQRNRKKYNEEYPFAENAMEQITTYYYLDRQIQKYFEQVKRHPDYENTIFLIYGDHGAAHLQLNIDNISNFKIPLIIFSPLLKQAKKFLGVSSQLDLAPTLINYLRLNYQPHLSENVAFLGKELSFSEKYENNRSLLLGTTTRSSEYFMLEDYYLYHNELYLLEDNLKPIVIENETVLQEIREQKENAQKLVEYCIRQNKIIPRKYIILEEAKRKNKEVVE